MTLKGKQHLDALQQETLMILRYYFALLRLFRKKDFDKISRSHFVDRIISMKALENDLVIRISKFDDKNKKTHSLHNLVKELNSHKDIFEIKSKLIEFTTGLRPLKTQRRHKQLAHLESGKEDNDYMIRYNLLPHVKRIVNLLDLITGKTVTYVWKDGSHEKFDLRNEILAKTHIAYLNNN
ncbi:hypothetical protein [Flagellimonas nanhaiensis]|uniref:HEPN AbiU2-like domain-containing protein n=1 Tax=Flagellimonas nanhaiensis TaxID=2292706 RepID=A0A371JQD2_9FLAO|nr:hypothetical protein [Allomuricauda nanhaiensis]RDY59720.1 hypothetical protein DX873_10170 [Allomuricauda nanhaiensis]